MYSRKGRKRRSTGIVIMHHTIGCGRKAKSSCVVGGRWYTHRDTHRSVLHIGVEQLGTVAFSQGPSSVEAAPIRGSNEISCFLNLMKIHPRGKYNSSESGDRFSPCPLAIARGGSREIRRRVAALSLTLHYSINAAPGFRAGGICNILMPFSI